MPGQLRRQAFAQRNTWFPTEQAGSEFRGTARARYVSWLGGVSIQFDRSSNEFTDDVHDL
jgi:hypothetical protein